MNKHFPQGNAPISLLPSFPEALTDGGLEEGIHVEAGRASLIPSSAVRLCVGRSTPWVFLAFLCAACGDGPARGNLRPIGGGRPSVGVRPSGGG